MRQITDQSRAIRYITYKSVAPVKMILKPLRPLIDAPETHDNGQNSSAPRSPVLCHQVAVDRTFSLTFIYTFICVHVIHLHVPLCARTPARLSARSSLYVFPSLSLLPALRFIFHTTPFSAVTRGPYVIAVGFRFGIAIEHYLRMAHKCVYKNIIIEKGLNRTTTSNKYNTCRIK